MNASVDVRYRRPWEYPDCPDCASDVFVDGSRRRHYDYRCNFCGLRFNSDNEEEAE